MGLVDKIKSESKKSGANKKKFIYFRKDTKKRIRFLNDVDDGMEIVFHDNYSKGINVPCQDIFGRDCPYCGDDELRTRSLFVWSVWDYDENEVKIFMFAVNQCSPIPALMAMYDNYGTLTDRDYVLTKTGVQSNSSFAVVPMDKAKMRNEKAKPLSSKSILKYLDKAFPSDGSGSDEDDTEDEEDEHPARKAKPASKAKVKDEEEDSDWGDEDDKDEDMDYESMSPLELFKECKKRNISDVLPKKNAKYYIKLLQEFDDAKSDWGEDDDENDEWEDEE